MGQNCIKQNEEQSGGTNGLAAAMDTQDTPMKFQISPTGLGQIYLAKVKDTAILPHADRNPEVDGTQPVYASIDDLKAKFEKDAEVMQKLRNKVKVCANCGKPCAYTLKDCNSCGASLSAIEISFSDNIFTCFIFGVGRGKFPYQISLRKQSSDFLCFDDVLSLSVCHLNVIPTSVYCPDLRFLFKDPPRGLALINSLFDFGASAALESFWKNPEYRRKYFNNETTPKSAEELFPLVLCGMNFPPSQFQLHLQFIHTPMLPFHYAQAREENHFHYRRFFPLEYLQKALALGNKVKMDINDDTSVEDILSTVEKHGINYDQIQISLLRRCRQMQERFVAWKEDDFGNYVVGGNKILSTETLGMVSGEDPKKIQAADTQALQNYGRPYNKDGKPTGTYYKYAKSPTELKTFGA